MLLFIYCGGGIGRETYDIVRNSKCDDSKWLEICFIDDAIVDNKCHNARQFTYEQFKKAFSPQECRVVIANGEPLIRKELAAKVLGDNYVLGRIIDPTACISPSARLGEGVIIFPYTYISSCAVVGDNVLVSVGSAIGHDSFIGDNTVVSTLVSISGNCSIGSGCYIGTNSCIRESICIGENTIIGMGSCVFRNVRAGMIALGNPARETRANTSHRVFAATK